MLKLSYSSGKFILPDGLAHDEFCDLPASEVKATGWKYKKEFGWYTTNPLTAFTLRKYADEKVKNIFHHSLIQYKRWGGGVIVPENETTLPHQIPSALFALNRNRSYLALAPGLGKTIVAAIISATLGDRVLYICPPSLTINTMEEFKRWATNLSVGVLGIGPDWIVPDVLIVPDSMIHDEGVRRYIRFTKPKVLFYDEAQRIKNPDTRRAEAFFGYYKVRKKQKLYVPGIADRFLSKLIYLSGTPTDGRPIELFSILKKSAPQYIDFMNHHQYGMKYCGGHLAETGYGKQPYAYDYNGCNEKEFKKLVNEFRTHDPENMFAFMLRLDKDILNLPKLTENVLFLSEDMPVELKSMDTKMVKEYSPEDLIKYSLAEAAGKDEYDLHIAEYRKLLGVHKMKPAARYYKEILEDTNEKIILSAYHIDVVYGLADILRAYHPLVLNGGISTQTKNNMVKEFQTNKKRRLFIMNYVAGGLGLTLTKAHRIGLIEYAWGPNANRQVIDRGHRFTLKHPFLAQYCIFRNSLDAHTFNVNDKKRRITNFI